MSSAVTLNPHISGTARTAAPNRYRSSCSIIRSFKLRLLEPSLISDTLVSRSSLCPGGGGVQTLPAGTKTPHRRVSEAPFTPCWTRFTGNDRVLIGFVSREEPAPLLLFLSLLHPPQTGKRRSGIISRQRSSALNREDRRPPVSVGECPWVTPSKDGACWLRNFEFSWFLFWTLTGSVTPGSPGSSR